MKKKFICIKDCEYVYTDRHSRGYPIYKTYTFRKDTVYIISSFYLLSKANTVHDIFKDTNISKCGLGSTKFIYANFVEESEIKKLNHLFEKYMSV